MVNVNIREINLINQGKPRIILNNISFTLLPGNIYCLIGKNGCGKTTLLKSLTSLHDKRVFEITGKVMFKGTDLLSLTDDHLVSLREKYVKYVFQDSVSSFNPLMKLNYYFKLPGVNKIKLESLLEKLMLPDINIIGKMHSYELSGGMAQRLSLAIALSANPILLILDEPNSGIDYALSNLISGILKDYIKESNSIIFIVTQDIAFAENTASCIGFINENTFSGFYDRDELFKTESANTKFLNFISVYNSL